MKQLYLFFAIFLMTFFPIQWVNATEYDFAYTYQGNTLYYKITDGFAWVVCPRVNSGIFYWGYNKPTGNLIIPATVEDNNGNTFTVNSIGWYAFRDCTGITSVTIPNTIITISLDAFRGCTGIQSVSIGSSVSTIGDNAFDNCTGLSSIILGDSVTTIGASAFYHCSALSSINIPNSVTSIGSSAFGGCTNITSVTIGNNVAHIGARAFSNCTHLTSINIPNSVTYIGGLAFSYCNMLTSITIGASVAYLGNNIFGGCANLSHISISTNNPYYDSRNNCNAIIQTSLNCLVEGCKNTVITNTINSIGARAFWNCSGLTSISIPSSVTIIGDSAFMDCRGLSSIIIPNSVTTIGKSAFSGCGALSTISIPNSVGTLGESAFEGCTNLSSVLLPNSIVTINNRVFKDCENLTDISIPNTIRSIRSSSFENCRSLTTVILPYLVTSIGNYAFGQCDNLTKIISLSSEAPTIQSNTFYNVSNSLIINIPCGSLSSYYGRWGYFQNFSENAEIMLDVSTTDSVMGSVAIITPPTCQDHTAIIQAIAIDGYVFDHWSDGNTDNPRTLTIDSYTNITGYFASLDIIDDVPNDSATIYSVGGSIFIEGSKNNTVRLYDIYGRILAIKQSTSNILRLDIPHPGLYLIKIGRYPTRKVVVIQ